MKYSRSVRDRDLLGYITTHTTRFFPSKTCPNQALYNMLVAIAIITLHETVHSILQFHSEIDF